MAQEELNPGEHVWLWCCDDCGDMFCDECFTSRDWDESDQERCEANRIEGPMPEGGYP